MSRYLQSKNFCRDRRGNVAILFGLMAVPVLGVVGTAIDYGRAAKTKQELQSLIDGAALAATSEYTKTGDASTASTRLRSFVEDGLAKHSLSLLPPAQPGENPPTLGADTTKVLLENADFDGESATVSPKLTARVATTLLALVDQPYFEIEAATKAGLAGKKLELSMMLDITGSMCDGNNQPCSSGVKLTGMKNAAKDLLDIIFTGNGANTRVAIVPFSQTVNVGGTRVAAVTGQAATRTVCTEYRSNGSCRSSQTQYRQNCVAERNAGNVNDPRTSTRYQDDAPAAGKYSLAVWTTNSNAVANCTPGSTAVVLPLTNTRSVLEAKIDSLVAQGGTAGHVGTAWAWYAISDKWASFWGTDSAPEAANPKLLKAAVLMTDGEYNYCQGTTSCSTSDDQALKFCQNMKEQGIRVFTVGFQVPDSARPLLQSCASPGDYHFPYSSADMREAFRSIGNALMAGTAGPVLAN